MSNSLGVNFLRFVNEEGGNGWCQVFARLPFDDVELREKGALFGVVFGAEKENWGDVEVELTNWVEEFFNKMEGQGKMGLFFEEFKKKFPLLKGGWLWVTRNGDREVRMVSGGGMNIFALRKGGRIDFGDKVENKVLMGRVQNGDIFCLATPEMGADWESWDEEIKEKSMARCGLKIEFVESEVQSDFIEVAEPVLETAKETVQSEKVEKSEPLVENLASDNYVGPIGWREKLRNFIGKFRSVGRSRDDSVLIVGEVNKRKKWSVVLGVIFLAVLAVSLVSGSIKMKKDEDLKKWTEFSEPIEKRLIESVGLVGINGVGAKKIVEETKVMFEQGKVPLVANGYAKEVAALEVKIADVWTKVSGEREGGLEDLLNLELVRSGVEALRMSLIQKGQLVILGPVSGLVMTGDIENKEVKVVAGKGAGLGWLDAVSDGTKTIIMTKGGVVVAGKESSLLSFDTAVADPVAMSRFGKNIYILEKTNKEIFRYAITDEGFGERVRWLKEGVEISGTPIDMAIDVDIWVLEEGNKIERFRRGAKEDFSMSGLDEKIKIEKIAVEQDGDRVALFGSEGVVVICSKETGACNQQILNGRLKQARDIEFDESGKLLVLFAGSVGVLN